MQITNFAFVDIKFVCFDFFILGLLQLMKSVRFREKSWILRNCLGHFFILFYLPFI